MVNKERTYTKLKKKWHLTKHGKNKMNLALTLPYIRWGLVWDPQNKRRMPVFIKKKINIKYSRNKYKERRYYNDDTY